MIIFLFSALVRCVNGMKGGRGAIRGACIENEINILFVVSVSLQRCFALKVEIENE